MTTFLQIVLTGIGLGSAYALFAQGVVLIYRGSGIVNFAQGALGMVASYITFATCRDSKGWPIAVCIFLGIAAAVAVALAYQFLVLRMLTNAAPITRLISTLGLLVATQSAIELKYGKANQAVDAFLPHETFDWGGVKVQEQVLYIMGVALVVTAALWAFARYTRAGLAITAAAQNERAVQTLGWSPNSLSILTWGIGGGLAGLAGILVAPLTGLSTITFTNVVTITALAAALLGGFKSFPMTLLGGYIIGIGESMAVRYKGDIQDIFFGGADIRGMPRAIPFIVILVVLVVRGRGLPLRSHLSDRLPKLGTGRINIPGLFVGSGILLVLLFTVFNDKWASATYISLSSAVIVLSIVVLTGYAGQLSLGQMAIAGIGALISSNLILRAGWPTELAIVAGILATIPAGVVFALPALRTRGVNLAVVTLGLGYAVQEVIFANGKWIGNHTDGGTAIGPTKLFGVDVTGFQHPHRWAVVCLIAFVLAGLMVANLRRSRTGRRLIAVRTNERAAASLGVSVFGVKLYAFAVSSGIAALGGILLGFRFFTVTYSGFNMVASIFAVGYAVIGGLGYVVGAAFSAPNALGGIGTRITEDLLKLDSWDGFIGGVILLVIIVFQQDGVAAKATVDARPLLKKLRLTPSDPAPVELPPVEIEPVEPKSLKIEDLTVRFGLVTAVDHVNFEVNPGEVVGLIGPNGAGKTTIIDAVTGFVKPSSGRLTLDGTQINSWSATKRARGGLRRSFQSLELFEDISVEDNIRAGDDSASAVSWLTDLFWPGNHPLSSPSVAAIKEFELTDQLGKLPGELPYGQRRLVGIARSVASGPSVIMLDEPAAGLDETEGMELATLIRRMADERGMGVLLVEHDVGLVMSTCDRIVVIDFGQVIASGTPDEIRKHPAVLDAYLGTSDSDHDVIDLDSENEGATV